MEQDSAEILRSPRRSRSNGRAELTRWRKGTPQIGAQRPNGTSHDKETVDLSRDIRASDTVDHLPRGEPAATQFWEHNQRVV